MFGDWKIAALCTSRVYDLQVHGFIAALNEQLQKKGFVLWVYALNEDLYWEEDKYPAEASVFGYIPYEYVDVVIIMDEKIKSRKVVQRVIDKACRQQREWFAAAQRNQRAIVEPVAVIVHIASLVQERAIAALSRQLVPSGGHRGVISDYFYHRLL